jgi:hypothetical protein
MFHIKGEQRESSRVGMQYKKNKMDCIPRGKEKGHYW